MLAVVAAGFAVGHNASEASFAARIQERQFWRTTDALLEAFVFAYIGLQLRFVIEEAEHAGFDFTADRDPVGGRADRGDGRRFAWVFGTALVARWRGRVRATPRSSR